MRMATATLAPELIPASKTFLAGKITSGFEGFLIGNGFYLIN
jgi:hypothetical protein